MRISAVSFTEAGDKINAHIGGMFSSEEYFGFGKTGELLKREEGISEWAKRAFSDSDMLIFIGAVGIAVRACAPYIKSKDKDPAVIAVDERGEYVIPILSGHIGGANAAARRIAGFLGAQAVITTATDINGVWAADEWAAGNGYKISDISQIKYISSAVLRGEDIGLVCDFPMIGKPPAGISDTAKCGIVISADDKKRPFIHTLNIVVPCVHIGVGAKKNAGADDMIELIKRVCAKNHISESAVARIATIDIKKNENAVLEAGRYFDCGLSFFSARELSEVKGVFSESEFVKKTVGVGNVCERAAARSAGGKLIAGKTAGAGVTAAAAVENTVIDFTLNGGQVPY